jgi:hypothetical protein
MGDKGKNEYTGDKDFDEILDKVFRIMKTKAVDYAKEGDRLAQFRSAAVKYDLSMRQVLGVYMDKHLESVNKWICGEELKGEPIEDKLLDNIVYSLLGYKIAKEERRSRTVEQETKRFPENATEADVGIVVCDMCGREMTLGQPPSSKLSFAEWKHEVGNSPFACNVCVNDPDTMARAPAGIQEAVRRFTSMKVK